METRIELILKTKNLSPSQLADRIGVQRSSVSHILARRNKPSLDFVQKILKAFPEIQPNWLLFAQGPMFDSQKAMGGVASDSLSASSNSFNDSVSEPEISSERRTEQVSQHEQMRAHPEGSFDFDLMSERDEFHAFNDAELHSQREAYVVEEPARASGPVHEHNKSAPLNGALERVVFFYADGTCRVYSPK